MQTDPRCDSVTFIQAESEFRRILPKRHDRDNADSSFDAVPADDTDQVFVFECFHLPEETGCQIQLMREDAAFRLLRKPGEGGLQSGNSGKVQRSGLKAVRQEGGDLLRMADAAGSAGDQRLQFFRHFPADQEAAGSLGTEKPFVAGKGERVDAHPFHIQRKNAGSLCRIQDKADAAGPADSADLRDGTDR